MDDKKVMKLSPEDLENVSGGEIYGKPVGDHFEGDCEKKSVNM